MGLCLCKFPQVPRFSQCRNIHIGSANDCKMTLNCLMTAGKSSSPRHSELHSHLRKWMVSVIMSSVLIETSLPMVTFAFVFQWSGVETIDGTVADRNFE